MKIEFWSVGKAHEGYVQPGVLLFTERIGYYYPVEWQLMQTKKTATDALQQKHLEAALITGSLKPGDYLVALDENGTMLTSRKLSRFIDDRAVESNKRLIFLIGGAFGLDPAVLALARYRWSLSALTFPHQLVRLILCEQIYRACSISRNEKYHHD